MAASGCSRYLQALPEPLDEPLQEPCEQIIHGDPSAKLTTVLAAE
jgi:hypothetical protein